MDMKDSYHSFSGEALRHRELPGFAMTEVAYSPGLKMRNHSHEPAYFGLVLQGAYTEKYGQKNRNCKASTLVFHPPGEDHAVEFHWQGARIFRVEIKPECLERVREHSVTLDRPAGFQGGWPTWLAARLYNEFQETDRAAPLAIEGLTLEILAETARHQSDSSECSPPRWLRQAKDLLHDQFSENLSLAAVAEAVRVHPVYLARAWRKHFHCTVGQYLRQLRIENACREIARSDTPLAEIAAAAGFYDQSHFSRTFKRITGLTPAEYRIVFRAS
ncbi:MAG: AraC family transcriptional regulator [Blastocatellia bacterium]|nr:AraC family transcriptional regulator [Blastocatellia bacterium]